MTRDVAGTIEIVVRHRVELSARSPELSRSLAQLADAQDWFRVSTLNARRTELKLAAALRRKLMKPITKIALATRPKESSW